MNNNTTSVGTSSGSSSQPDDLTLFFLSSYLIMFTITLITNGITIFIIARTPSLRTRTNAFIASLSACDILFALFMMGVSVTAVVHIYINFAFDQIAAQAYVYFAWGILIYSSNGNLILVSIERWLYLIHPFWYQRHISGKVVIISISVIWLSALAVNLPYITISDYAWLFFSNSYSYFTVSHAYFYPGVHTVCCLILIAIYTHIAVTTFRHMKNISRTKPQDQQERNDNTSTVAKAGRSTHAENWKAIKLLIIICGLFIVFVSPYVYVNSYVLMNPRSRSSLNHLQTASFFLLSLHHCTNFFVYVLSNRQFRRALKNLVNRFCCCRKHRVGQIMDTEATATVFDVQTRTQRITEVGSVF